MQSSSDDLRTLIETALADNILTRTEEQQIMKAVLADRHVSDEEHALLDLIVDKISRGEIKSVND